MKRSASERLRMLQMRRAMSLDQAKALLGFSPSDNPTREEVERSYKKKALENHPDRGGDPEKMKEINVARDVLEGRQRPTDSGGGRGPSQSPYSNPAPRRPPPPPPKPEHVSWEQAMQAANVPTSGVEWVFVTDSGYGGYGDTSHSGYVVYGKSASQHVFVGVEHYSDRGNAFTPLDIDKYTMYVRTAPLGSSIAQVAPAVIRSLWKNFGGIKQYNAKVKILDKGTKFTSKLDFYHGRSVSFKQALGMLGEETPSAWKGKVEIKLELSSKTIKVPGMRWDEYRPTLVINGKPYELSDKATLLVEKNSIYRKMWGKTYYYGNSVKVITKMRDKKKWLELWKQICEKAGEKQEVIQALDAAMAQ